MQLSSTIRTQISLTAEIKRAIEAKKRLTGESMSEYLRKAALIRLASESEEEKELKMIAKNFVGAGRFRKTHPVWKNKKSINKWLRDLRSEWD